MKLGRSVLKILFSPSDEDAFMYSLLRDFKKGEGSQFYRIFRIGKFDYYVVFFFKSAYAL